jgi:hypothetical protein
VSQADSNPPPPTPRRAGSGKAPVGVVENTACRLLSLDHVMRLAAKSSRAGRPRPVSDTISDSTVGPTTRVDKRLDPFFWSSARPVLRGGRDGRPYRDPRSPRYFHGAMTLELSLCTRVSPPAARGVARGARPTSRRSGAFAAAAAFPTATFAAAAAAFSASTAAAAAFSTSTTAAAAAFSTSTTAAFAHSSLLSKNTREPMLNSIKSTVKNELRIGVRVNQSVARRCGASPSVPGARARRGGRELRRSPA